MPSLSLIRDSLHLVGFNFSSSCEQQPIWTDLRIGWVGLRRRLNYVWWRYNQLLLLFCCPSSSNVTCRPLLLVMDVSTALNVFFHGTLSHLHQLNSPKVHLIDDISWLDFCFLTVWYFEGGDMISSYLLKCWRKAIARFERGPLTIAKLAHPVLQVMFYRFKKCG